MYKRQVGFSNRPILGRKYFYDTSGSVLELDHTPAGEKAPTVLGLIDLSDGKDYGDAFTAKEYADDIAVRLIWPVGHYRSRDPANNRKRLDEYELKGNTITIVGPTLFNYTGQPTTDGSGRRLYYVVKYKYNSKLDPTPAPPKKVVVASKVAVEEASQSDLTMLQNLANRNKSLPPHTVISSDVHLQTGYKRVKIKITASGAEWVGLGTSETGAYDNAARSALAG